MIKTFTTAIALSILAAAAAPIAAAKYEPVSVEVDTSGLDLASEKGIQMLEQRFAAEIRLACGQPDGRSIKQLRAVRYCRDSFAEPVAVAIADVARNPQRFAARKTITVRV